MIAAGQHTDAADPWRCGCRAWCSMAVTSEHGCSVQRADPAEQVGRRVASGSAELMHPGGIGRGCCAVSQAPVPVVTAGGAVVSPRAAAGITVNWRVSAAPRRTAAVSAVAPPAGRPRPRPRHAASDDGSVQGCKVSQVSYTRHCFSSAVQGDGATIGVANGYQRAL